MGDLHGHPALLRDPDGLDVAGSSVAASPRTSEKSRPFRPAMLRASAISSSVAANTLGA